MTTLTVRAKRSGPILSRHPWVFAGALNEVPEGLATGAAVRLTDGQGRFLAQGYFNGYSQIAVRLWSWDENEAVDESFFQRRVAQALELRERMLAETNTNAYRLIFAENDFLPGLVVDRYSDWLCLQCHTRGVDAWREQILAALIEVVEPRGVYERSDVKVRSIEGATARTGVMWGSVPERVEIRENGIRFLVDIREGQKTGFFLDQRDKRLALQRYVRGKRVLNCFCYTGGFSIFAGAAGATQVVSVDTSGRALELAAEHVRLNQLDEPRFTFVGADVKAYLAEAGESRETFDVIVLDPPAFVKDRRRVKEGLAGYRRINEAALRLLPPGGLLVSCSCSSHVSEEDFRHVLAESAARAGRSVQILESFRHSIDHPELVAFREAAYLKCLFAAVR